MSSEQSRPEDVGKDGRFYLAERCPRCREKVLDQIENRYRCNNPRCGFAGDLFQDGDSVEV
jgi:hypothetical protein